MQFLIRMGIVTSAILMTACGVVEDTSSAGSYEAAEDLGQVAQGNCGFHTPGEHWWNGPDPFYDPTQCKSITQLHVDAEAVCNSLGLIKAAYTYPKGPYGCPSNHVSQFRWTCCEPL